VSDRTVRRRDRVVHQPELEPLRGPLSESAEEQLAELGGLAGGYKAVQLLIGAVALLFGPVLVVGYWITGGSGLGPSMSSYYHSDLRDVFVGMLFALALLFATYHFHPIVWPPPVRSRDTAAPKPKPDVSYRVDNWLANAAGVAAVLLALFPTNKNPHGDPAGGNQTVHSLFGATMFLLLALFAGWRFRKSSGRLTPEKRLRNRVYLGCGVLMLVFLGFFAYRDALFPGVPDEIGTLSEMLALCVFAISWLLKSDYFRFLADRPKSENAFNSPAEVGKVQTTQRAWRSTVRDGPAKSFWMWLTERVDRVWGWDRLRVFPALLTLLGLRMRLRRENLFDATGVTVGWGPERSVPSRRLTRSIDGTETDPHHPGMGAAGSRFGRNIAPDQLDSTDPTRVMSPNPRTVSNQLLARRAFVPASGLNMLFAAWIQFEVHDWMHHRLEPGRAWDVPLDPADPWAARTPNGAMAILRSEVDAAYGGDEGPPNYRSTSTHWWDASQIYGSDPQVAPKLRTGHGGRLRLTDDGRLPFDPTDPDDPLVKEVGGGAALVGASNGWWLGLAMLHTLFMREHNAICDHLARSYPTWTDQQLFDTARLVNAALMAKIHTVEWTPALLANPVLERAMNINWWGFEGQAVERWLGRLVKSEELSGIPGTDLYYHGVPYAITEEFVAVYRLHPLIPDDYEIRSSADNSVLLAGRFSEISGRRTHDLLDGKIAMSDLLYSFAIAHPGQAVLHNFPEELRTFSDPDAGLVDLAAVDILRNRERGVPRYNEFRRQFRLEPAKRFEDFSDDPTIVEELAAVYATPEDVDLIVGLYTERKPDGFAISDTAFRVFILMASRRLKSDRFYTYDYRPGVYTQEGLDWIDTNTLSSVILRHHPDLGGVVRTDNAFKPWSIA
jgi:Animal haem peroxidase